VEYTLRIDSKFMETFGTATLAGALGTKYPDAVWSAGTEVILEFIQSSTSWRAQNDGPNLWVMPEYSPMCFAADLLRLQARGVKFHIETITEDPK
jgi:hypothetical protein